MLHGIKIFPVYSVFNLSRAVMNTLHVEIHLSHRVAFTDKKLVFFKKNKIA